MGLPGDTIRVVGSQVLRERNRRLRLRPGELYSGPKNEQYPFTHVGEERLGSKMHDVLLDPARPGMEGEWRVPPGHLLHDGRQPQQQPRQPFPDVGFVPEENVIGKAEAIWLSFNPDRKWRLLWNRMGNRDSLGRQACCTDSVA